MHLTREEFERKASEYQEQVHEFDTLKIDHELGVMLAVRPRSRPELYSVLPDRTPRSTTLIEVRA